MTNYVTSQLESCSYFSLDLGEHTNTGNIAQFLVYVRMIFSHIKIKEPVKRFLKKETC